jgi:hypothetical protein
MRRAFILVLLALALSAGAGHAASSSPVVVSQVYAGGGNTGATYQNDFVELLNRSSSPVDLSGWTVQYATAAGTSWSTATLTGTLAAGHYYLVQFASAGAIGAIIPAPDALGTTNLAASGGKVALVHATTALTCGATAGSCSATSGVQDLVGYGSATDFEGAVASALDATHAALRDSAGCIDTDANAADFSAAAPTPRNTSSAAAACGVTPPAGGTASQGVSVDADVQQSLAIALEKPALSFGQVVSGSTPAPLHEHVTVTSNLATGYTLSAHRTAFTPADLPLGIGITGPAGATIPPAFSGGAIVALAGSSATELLLGTTSAAAPAAGDVWDGAIGFSAPIPSVAPGHYSTTVTFTVVGR